METRRPDEQVGRDCRRGIRVRSEDAVTNWRKSEPKIWRWRVRGKSSDSRVVTLGKYDTEAEAKVDRARIIDEGFYRNVRIEQVPVALTPANASATQ